MTLLVTLLGSTLMLLSPVARSDESPHVEPIPQQTLLDYLGGKNNFTLIDARSAEEYAAGHVWNAVHLAHDANLATSEVLPADLDAPLVIYCKSGKRSETLQQNLLAAGYTNVRVLYPEQMLWAGELPVFNCGATGTSTELATANTTALGGKQP
jgi:rhodanese-related sulfurtransferase